MNTCQSLVLACAALLMAPAASAQERITYKVIGQPAATGMIRRLD